MIFELDEAYSTDTLKQKSQHQSKSMLAPELKVP
jgi:hypothetical protein